MPFNKVRFGRPLTFKLFRLVAAGRRATRDFKSTVHPTLTRNRYPLPNSAPAGMTRRTAGSMHRPNKSRPRAACVDTQGAQPFMPLMVVLAASCCVLACLTQESLASPARSSHFSLATS